MNPNTGEIREFSSDEQRILEGFTIPLKSMPKLTCPKCYGRGHVGINDEGQHVPCACTQRRNSDVPSP